MAGNSARCGRADRHPEADRIGAAAREPHGASKVRHGLRTTGDQIESVEDLGQPVEHRRIVRTATVGGQSEQQRQRAVAGQRAVELDVDPQPPAGCIAAGHLCHAGFAQAAHRCRIGVRRNRIAQDARHRPGIGCARSRQVSCRARKARPGLRLHRSGTDRPRGKACQQHGSERFGKAARGNGHGRLLCGVTRTCRF